MICLKVVLMPNIKKAVQVLHGFILLNNYLGFFVQVTSTLAINEVND